MVVVYHVGKGGGQKIWNRDLITRPVPTLVSTLKVAVDAEIRRNAWPLVFRLSKSLKVIEMTWTDRVDTLY